MAHLNKIYINRIVAKTPDTTDIKSVDRAEKVLVPEYLNLHGKLERVSLAERVDGKRVGYLTVSLTYDNPVTLDFAYGEFGRILNDTSHGGMPVDLFTDPRKLVQLDNVEYPNPMRLKRVPRYDGFSTPVEVGHPLDMKLGYTVVIRVPNYFPEKGLEGLSVALKSGRPIRPEMIKGNVWFQDVLKKATVIPRRRKLPIGDQEIDFLDIEIESHVREGDGYNLIKEINEYFKGEIGTKRGDTGTKGFREWYTGSTEEGESRNSMMRFLEDPNNKAFRRWLERQRREQEGITTDDVKAGSISQVGQFLGDNLDIGLMNSKLSSTPPGGQARPLLPYVVFNGVLFEEEKPTREVQHGDPIRIVKLYRVKYDGGFMTAEEREKAFSPEFAEFRRSN